MASQNKTDFTWTADDHYISFLPCTPLAVGLWNETPVLQGIHPLRHKDTLIAKLKDAGWTVRKSPKVKPSKTDAELLAALGL